MARKRSLLLTDAELRLMDVLWSRGRATVSEVLESLAAKPPLAYSTVITTLRILEGRPPISVFLVPLLSIAIEVAFAAVLVIAIGKTLRNTRRASSLLSS